MDMPLLTLEIRLEPDLILSRQRARQIAGLLGFPLLDQTRIATATSEMVRYAYQHARGGRVEFVLVSGPPANLMIRIRERGPRIKETGFFPAPPDGSPLGLGAGALAAKRLMDDFEVEAEPGGSVRVTMTKRLPARMKPLTGQDLARLSDDLARHAPQGLLEELQEQNQELLRTLQELRDRQAEIVELHARELDETNRGVVALYAELEENEKALRRISDLKSRFLSDMSHEFRSPLNSILSLCGFLLGESDGELNTEQVKQVSFIRRAAESLSALVNDLLDLAMVEAGKAVVRIETFEIATLFDTLKGTTRPILTAESVALVFEDSPGVPPLSTDQGKVIQILRNFLSNAVKFTERGEIRVSARSGPGATVIFSVADTGIGIAPEDQKRIFEEFGQLESPIQRRVQGTGLGLPLSKKLAELLGGKVMVSSTPELGSTFSAIIPGHYRYAEDLLAAGDTASDPVSTKLPVVVIEDDPDSLALYEKHFVGSRFQVIPAWTLSAARRILNGLKPYAILLDVALEETHGWDLLKELKTDAARNQIPVLVLTLAENQERAISLGADAFCRKPVSQAWLLDKLRALEAKGRLRSILIVDDQETDRYLIRQQLFTLDRYAVIEAVDGAEGLRRARDDRPDLIFLDLALPDMSGFDILERLKADPVTARIPVIVNTSTALETGDRERLAASTAAVLSKEVVEPTEALENLRGALSKAGLEPVAYDPGAV